MDNVAPQPEDNLKDVLVQFLGQTYSELNKIDNYIVGTSKDLAPKSQGFQQTATQVLNSISTQPQVQGRPAVVQSVVPNVVIPHVVQSIAPHNPDQMEFTFDQSSTAKSIQSAVDRIESKIDRLEKKITKLLENTKK